MIGPNGAGKTTLLSILAGIRAPDAGEVSGRRARSAGCRSRRRSTAGSRSPRTCACSPASRGSPTSSATVERMLEQTALARAPRRPGRRRSRAATSSGSTSRSGCSPARGAAARRAVAGLDPRQRERLWEFVLALAGGGTTVIFSTHNIQEAERYGERLLVLADGERVFDGTAARAARGGPRVGRPRLRGGVRRLPARAGALSRCAGCCSRTCRSCAARRWSAPCWSIYPIVIAVLIGFALSARAASRGSRSSTRSRRSERSVGGGEEEPRPRRSPATSSATGSSASTSRRREEAEQMVEDGDVLARADPARRTCSTSSGR